MNGGIALTVIYFPLATDQFAADVRRVESASCGGFGRNTLGQYVDFSISLSISISLIRGTNHNKTIVVEEA